MSTSAERLLARFIASLSADEVPASVELVLSRMCLAVVGAGIAGAGEDGVVELRQLLREAGGTPQASTWIFGDPLPAGAAAQFNGTLCRALDYCDALAPGPHIGSALIPAALSAVELVGGCTGAEFVVALAVGAEVAVRLNLSESQYDGFDPTGVLVVFASTAAAARILRLSEEQTCHALALAFNRCGGSFQSHIDGSLGVRIVQGWVAQTGLHCAQLARLNVTGPENFLTGAYAYGHLFGRGRLNLQDVLAGLGTDWHLDQIVFKKYPSCGATQGLTELALSVQQEHNVASADIRSVQVRLPPYAYRLVGHSFAVGGNPRVDAQFSAAYCVANALIRRSSTLMNFSSADIADQQIKGFANRVEVVADKALDLRGHTAVDLKLVLKNGTVLSKSLDVAPGFPGADLDDAQHRARFSDCLAYAPYPPAPAQARELLNHLTGLSALEDIRSLLPLITMSNTLDD